MRSRKTPIRWTSRTRCSVTEPQNPVQNVLNDELVLFSVGFSPEMVEVDFLDPRRQSKGMTEITKLGIERTQWADEIEHIEELVRDLIDDVLRERAK